MENLFQAVDVLMLGIATAFVAGLGIIYFGAYIEKVVKEELEA